MYYNEKMNRDNRECCIIQTESKPTPLEVAEFLPLISTGRTTKKN